MLIVCVRSCGFKIIEYYVYMLFKLILPRFKYELLEIRNTGSFRSNWDQTFAMKLKTVQILLELLFKNLQSCLAQE